jgi:hypothetical protein
MSTPPDLPGWAAMSERDQGAALVHAWKRAYEGTAHALEFYPCRYHDHPALVVLDPLDASDHAQQVTGGYETAQHRLGVAEVNRLYTLAAEHHNAAH